MPAQGFRQKQELCIVDTRRKATGFGEILEGENKIRKNKQILPALLAFVLCMGLCVPALAYDAGKLGTRNVVSAGGGHTAAVDSGGSLWT